MDLVSRMEIADCVEEAFTGTPVSASDIVGFAAVHGGRPPVLDALDRLNGTRYHSLRDLWAELADVPVEL